MTAPGPYAGLWSITEPFTPTGRRSSLPEALDEAVLLRLPRLYEAQAHAALVGPLVERPAGQLRSVVQDDLKRCRLTLADDPVRPDGDGRALRSPRRGLSNGAPDVRIRAHEP